MSQDRRYSFEFFPTKTDAGQEKLLATARQLAAYNPDFFSCTYGAGGSTRDRTLNTVLQLESEVKIPAAPHLSCVGDSKADLRGLLAQYKAAGIKRIVALRGDLPSGMGMASGEMRHANDLVEFIREETGDHFHIEVAAYPEMHPQATMLPTSCARPRLAPTVRSPSTSSTPTATSTSWNACGRWA
jgi:methylenetetrahydrofolate reductase (NADPH)